VRWVAKNTTDLPREKGKRQGRLSHLAKEGKKRGENLQFIAGQLSWEKREGWSKKQAPQILVQIAPNHQEIRARGGRYK